MAFVIGDWDNYISANNYRIHRGSTTSRWSFIPTGTDQTFQKAMNPFRGYSKGSFPILFEKCLASERCTAGYRDAIGKAVAAFKAPAGGLAGTMGRRMNLIDASVALDTRKPYDAAIMQSTRVAMKTLIEGRPDGVASALSCVANADRRAWMSRRRRTARRLAIVDGAAVLQRACADKAEQLFTMKVVNGGVQLVAKSSGKCLDLASADVHANLTQTTCSTASSQLWSQHASLFE